MNIQFIELNLIKKVSKIKFASKEWAELGLEVVKAGLISDIRQLFIGEYSHKNYIRYLHQIYAENSKPRALFTSNHPEAHARGFI